MRRISKASKEYCLAKADCSCKVYVLSCASGAATCSQLEDVSVARPSLGCNERAISPLRNVARNAKASGKKTTLRLACCAKT
jgi:predicted nucleic acid-binding Zn finger protein